MHHMTGDHLVLGASQDLVTTEEAVTFVHHPPEYFTAHLLLLPAFAAMQISAFRVTESIAATIALRLFII
jgi:hypothetical protein